MYLWLHTNARREPSFSFRNLYNKIFNTYPNGDHLATFPYAATNIHDNINAISNLYRFTDFKPARYHHKSQSIVLYEW